MYSERIIVHTYIWIEGISKILDDLNTLTD